MEDLKIVYIIFYHPHESHFRVFSEFQEENHDGCVYHFFVLYDSHSEQKEYLWAFSVQVS